MSDTDDAPSAATDAGAPADPESGGSPEGRLSRWRVSAVARRLGLAPWTVRVLAGLTLVGLVARLVGLGHRVAHFDEGRVAYWALRYAETGHFEYRSIIHGPLVQHVDRWLFTAVGPSDLVMRLPVALVGAALPLVVLWYRDHLEDVELVGMAGLLALNPLLLTYSRFLRSDLLVATFMLAALGALLRLRATGRPRYLYAAAALGALGFASKENAVLYVLCWLGAGALLLEVRLFRPHGHATGLAMARTRLGAFRSWLSGEQARLSTTAKLAGAHLAGAGALFLGLGLLLFAPRAGAAGGPGLWRAVADPTQLPAMLRATALDVGYGFGFWFAGAAEPACRKETFVAGYGCFLWRMTRTVGQFGTATALLAAVGFLRERYALADSRPIVMAAGFWGVASFLGYPLGTDIWAAWVAVHVIVPLAIPAGVGFGALVGIARRGLGTNRRRLALVAVTVVAVLGLWTGAVAVQAAYVEDTTREHRADSVQYAQPQQDLKPVLGTARRAVENNEGGVDVVYYGKKFTISSESVADQPPLPESDEAWFDRLPLPWYFEGMDATRISTNRQQTAGLLLESRPPVVVTPTGNEPFVAGRLEEYRTYEVDIRAHVGGPKDYTSVTVFVDERRLNGSSSAVRVGSTASERVGAHRSSGLSVNQKKYSRGPTPSR